MENPICEAIYEDVATVDVSALPHNQPLLPSLRGPASFDSPNEGVPSTPRVLFHQRNGLCRQPSIAQWEDIKLLVRRLYIEENICLRDVLEHLRREKNLLVTKKQLTTRLKSWGFQKNANAKDRERFFRNFDGQRNEFSIGKAGRKINRARFERWQKAYGKAADQPPVPATREFQDSGAEIGSTSLFNLLSPPSGVKNPLHTDLEKVPLSEVTKLDQAIAAGESWPFASGIDITSIPKLSRLLAVLKIEYSEEIKTISLSPPVQAPSKIISTNCLSNSQLLDLSLNRQRLDDLDQRVDTPRPWESQSLVYTSARYKQTKSPLKFPHVDFLLSQKDNEEPLQPNPFNEVYFFPVQESYSIRANVQRTSTSRASSFSQIAEIRELCDSELRDPLCYENQPRIIRVMEDHASDGFRARNYKEAEFWYRRALRARKRTQGSYSNKAIYSLINLSILVTEQGRYNEAAQLQEEARLAILAHSGPTKRLFMVLLVAKSAILSHTEQHEEEAKCRQEVLQVAINTHGLRHNDTLQALAHLGNSLLGRGDSMESQHILSIMLELCHENTGCHDNYVIPTGLYYLARVFFKTKRVLESMSSIRMAVKITARLRGEMDPLTCFLMAQLAHFLSRDGKFEESEELLRTVVKYQLEIHGLSHPHTAESIYYLGKTLMLAGQYREGQHWLEISFKETLGLFGPGDDKSVWSCDYLGRCYETQELYDEAFELYEKHLERIRMAHGNDHPAIGKIEGWVASLRLSLQTVQTGLEEFVNIDES